MHTGDTQIAITFRFQSVSREIAHDHHFHWGHLDVSVDPFLNFEKLELSAASCHIISICRKQNERIRSLDVELEENMLQVQVRHCLGVDKGTQHNNRENWTYISNKHCVTFFDTKFYERLVHSRSIQDMLEPSPRIHISVRKHHIFDMRIKTNKKRNLSWGLEQQW